MKNILGDIFIAKKNNQKLLAILLDPDNIDLKNIDKLIAKINASPATHVIVGGNVVHHNFLDELILLIKAKSTLPVILFRADPSQFSEFADGILFQNLVSGQNPNFLIDYQVQAVPKLLKTNLEIIPTAYLLIDCGKESAVKRVTKTKPLPQEQIYYTVHTAVDGQLMANKMVFLETGSGAKNTVSAKVINAVALQIKFPLIVGGGIKSLEKIEIAYKTSADLVVVGTAFENDNTFFDKI
jgi:putative glycerol-1-phosphate prenyltransferase